MTPLHIYSLFLSVILAALGAFLGWSGMQLGNPVDAATAALCCWAGAVCAAYLPFRR